MDNGDCRQCDQIWRNFATLARSKIYLAIFESLFSVWIFFWTNCGKFWMSFGKFSLTIMAKYWKIIQPSGHTGQARDGPYPLKKNCKFDSLQKYLSFLSEFQLSPSFGNSFHDFEIVHPSFSLFVLLCLSTSVTRLVIYWTLGNFQRLRPQLFCPHLLHS